MVGMRALSNLNDGFLVLSKPSGSPTHDIGVRVTRGMFN